MTGARPDTWMPFYVGDYLRDTGHLSPADVSAWLLACDAVALPYRDGASLRRGSLMAALAHGCAVITTEPQSAFPGLRDGESARLVPAESAPALVLAVTGLLEAPELRARLGQGAAALAAQFAWPAIAKQVKDFLVSLIGLDEQDRQ